MQKQTLCKTIYLLNLEHVISLFHSNNYVINYIVFVYWNVRLTKVALLYLALVYYYLFKWRFEYTSLSITLFLMYCYCLLKRKIKYMSLFITLSTCSMITNIRTYILMYTVRWRAILYYASDFILFFTRQKKPAKLFART